jgi:hypothetical protein
MAIVWMVLSSSTRDTTQTHDPAHARATHTKPSPPTHKTAYSPTGCNVESKLRFALSLTRETLCIFIGDAAATQLLFPNAPLGLDGSQGLGVGSEAENAPLVFTREDWVQLGLAGCMWSLGASIWVMEPADYWVSRWRENRGNWGRVLCEKTRRLENGYFLLSQQDSNVETS